MYRTERKLTIVDVSLRKAATTAIIDDEAEITQLNLVTARKLGIDVATAKKAVWFDDGVAISGVAIRNVRLYCALGDVIYHAALAEVFVPLLAEFVDEDGRLHQEAVPAGEQQLIGQDFLAVSGSAHEFAEDEQRGEEPRSIFRFGPMVPASIAQRTRLRAMSRCCPPSDVPAAAQPATVQRRRPRKP